MNKIIIVDDHALFRQGIKLLIENENFGEVIAEAKNGKEFLDLLEIHHPDVVLMDIEMPVMDGLEATKLAMKMRPDLKILVLTMLSEKENYSDMVNAGALGFMLKTSGKAEFEKALQAVNNGDSYFSNELLRQIILNVGNMPHVVSEKSISYNLDFTSREHEILLLLCEGLSVIEIANNLNLCVKTVEAHRSTLLRKTNSKNTINLILHAIKNKMVSV